MVNYEEILKKEGLPKMVFYNFLKNITSFYKKYTEKSNIDLEEEFNNFFVIEKEAEDEKIRINNNLYISINEDLEFFYLNYTIKGKENFLEYPLTINKFNLKNYDYPFVLYNKDEKSKVVIFNKNLTIINILDDKNNYLKNLKNISIPTIYSILEEYEKGRLQLLVPKYIKREEKIKKLTFLYINNLEKSYDEYEILNYKIGYHIYTLKYNLKYLINSYI